MSRRRQSLALLAMLMALAAGPGVQGQEAAPGATVESLLSFAREHNQDYAAMRFEAQAAQERIAPAGALPDPRLRINLQDITRGGSQSPTLLPGRTGKTSYLWMQDLPWFGKRELRQDIASQDALAAQARAQGSWAELAGRIKALHAQRFLAQRSLQNTQDKLDLMQRLEKLALSRYANGLAPQQDVIRAQVEQGNLAAEQIALENDIHHLHTRLNALLARALNAPLTQPTALRALPAAERLDWGSLQERVRLRNPQLFAESARVRSAQMTTELTRKNRYPDVTLGIAPMQMGSSFKEWELMLEVNIPLQQGTRAAQEREAQAMLDAAEQRQQASANQVLAELSQALSALEAARRTEALSSTRLLPQAELTYQSALAGYENGKLDFATLLDAQRQIRLARLGQLKAQVEAQLQLAELERLLGEDL